MAAYLIGQDGPYTGTVFALEEEESWVLGRDPDVCTHALSDPMVSRKHAEVSLEDGVYYIANLSSINPLLVNGTEIQEKLQLQEDDIIQIGNNVLRFTEHHPEEQPATSAPSSPEKEEVDSSDLDLPELTLRPSDTSRWMGKVISGPNAGAEFGIQPGDTFILGKDPESADIVFQDLSVSRQHAKISADEDGVVTIEDLGSKNGVFVNGARIEEKKTLDSQDHVSLGTTSFLMIDRERSRETIYSPAATFTSSTKEKDSSKEEEDASDEEELKSWKDIFIPTRYLVGASCFGILILVAVVSIVSLFRAQSVDIVHHDETDQVQEIVKDFPTIEFSFNPANGELFLVGHVLTEVDQNELTYLINSLPFIEKVDNNVVVDELVWENMNALLAKNPMWRGIMVTAPQPGQFVLRGYLPTSENATELAEYVNRNFPYLNRLYNEVVVENNLQTQIQNLLIEKGFINVSFKFNNGELVFSGRVNNNEESDIEDLIAEIHKIQGVRLIKNFIIFTGESTTRIDLTRNYTVTGTSKFGDVSQYVLINGKILSEGDTLDGMLITGIEPDEVLLNKDGIKYKIDFNSQ